MRIKRKIYYCVQDTGDTYLWYTSSGWSKVCMHGASNIKKCKTMRQAMRHCRRINELGGKGHIGRFIWKKGSRLYREFHIPGFVPWTRTIFKDDKCT